MTVTSSAFAFVIVRFWHLSDVRRGADNVR